MLNKNLLINIYKIISKFYVFLFGRKKMQFLNNVIFSLSLDAKGFKNYGNFSKTGEQKFIKLIKNEIKLSLDIGANIGKYTRLLLKESKTKVIAFEPMSESFKKLEEVKLDFKDRLENYNFAIGNENTSKKIFYENEDSEKSSLIDNLDELSFINNTKKKYKHS